jgi:hypothetical protein
MYISSLSPFPLIHPSRQSFHVLVQRLAQKEKLVSQLQSEIDRLTLSNPVEVRESVRSSSILNCILLIGFAFPAPRNRMNGLSVNERKLSGLA